MAKDQSWIADLLNGVTQIYSAGTPLPPVKIVNFLGGSAVYNATLGSADVTLDGGGGATTTFPIFNVKASPYNAAGDGVTDDTAAIKSAISAKDAIGGGTIYFPRGNYKTSSAIDFGTAACVIAGDGWASTDPTAMSNNRGSFIYTTMASGNAFTVGDSAGSSGSVLQGFVIRDLAFVCTVGGNNTIGLSLRPTVNADFAVSLLDNLWIYGFGVAGLNPGSARESIFRNLYVTNCGTGVLISGSTFAKDFHNNFFYGLNLQNNIVGLNARVGSNNSFYGGLAKNNTVQGIVIYPGLQTSGPQTVSTYKFDGFWFEGNGVADVLINSDGESAGHASVVNQVAFTNCHSAGASAITFQRSASLNASTTVSMRLETCDMGSSSLALPSYAKGCSISACTFSSVTDAGANDTIVGTPNFGASSAFGFSRLGTIANVQTVFNVRDPAYGAKGDGTTDDTAAIQAAFNAKDTAGGGTVFFPIGHYKITSAIDIGSAICVVRGERWNSNIGGLFGDAGWGPAGGYVTGSCIHQVTAGANGLVWSHFGTGMGIRDLAIIGAGSGSGTGVLVTPAQSVIDLNLHDVLIANFGTGYNPGVTEECFTKSLWLLGNNLGALIGSITTMTGNPSVTFSVGAQTITRAAGSWLTDNFATGMTVDIRNTVSNNTLATGVITTLTATVMTLASGIAANETTASGANVSGNNATNDSRHYDFICQDCNQGLILGNGGGHRFFGGIFQGNRGTAGPCVTFKSMPNSGPRDCTFDSFWMEGNIQSGSGGNFLFDTTFGQMGGIDFKRMHVGEAGAKVIAFTGSNEISGVFFEQAQFQGAVLTIPANAVNVTISPDSSFGTIDNTPGGLLINTFPHVLSAAPTSSIYPYGTRIENTLPTLASPSRWITTRQGQAGQVWTPNLSSFAGQTIIPPADNGHVYTSSGGHFGNSVPIFPTGSGATVVSGAATLTEAGPSSLVVPTAFLVPSTVNSIDCTAGVTTIGQAVGACQKWTFGFDAVGRMAGAVTTVQFTLGRPWKRSRIKSVLVDITQGFSGTSIATIQCSVGDGASNGNYLGAKSIAATGQIGILSGDLGAYLSAPVQGGHLVWSPTSTDDIVIAFAASGANLSALSTGSLDVYVEFDVLGAPV